MPDEPENHTIALLNKMREEQRAQHEDLSTKINGLTMIVTSLAGYMHGMDERIEKLEVKGE